MNDLEARVPLRVRTGAATFAIGIAGYLGVNLSPYMITALQEGFGTDVLTASWIVTATLLATAVTGLVTAPWCAGRHRRLVARIGLAAGVAGFLVAALVGVPRSPSPDSSSAASARAARSPPPEPRSRRSATRIASRGSTDSPTAA